MLCYFFERPARIHANMQTTEMYTRVDPSIKLEALEAITPPKLRSRPLPRKRQADCVADRPYFYAERRTAKVTVNVGSHDREST